MSGSLITSRACKSCYASKVRCTPSADDAQTCERCWRADKECVPAGTRRRPRDRIAELEAQVAQLSKALQSQRITHQAQVPSTDVKSGASSVRDGTSPALRLTGISTTLDFLDAHVPMALQQKALDTFVNQVATTCPLVPLSLLNLEKLREDAPVLLLALITFPASPMLSATTRDEMLEEVMRTFAIAVIAQPMRRIEIVLALLIAAYWFRSRPGSSHVTLHQLAQMATSMAIDIGIAGQLTATPGAQQGTIYALDPIQANHTWLACFVISSSLSISIRRLDIHARWTGHHEVCLNELESKPTAWASGGRFIHLIKQEKLCSHIAESLSLCDLQHVWDLASDEWKKVSSRLQKDIDNLNAEMPFDADYYPMSIRRYFTIICLHEPALHTSSNKWSFGAPSRVEAILESDFAAPVITGAHIAALNSIKLSCHALLDLASHPTAVTFLAICPLLYTAHVSYALFILVKLYVSVSAQNNTYGSILRPQDLRLAHYLQLLQGIAADIQELNPGSFNARIFLYNSVLNQWYKDYSVRTDVSTTDGSALRHTKYHTEQVPDSGRYEENADLLLPDGYMNGCIELEDYDTWLFDLFKGT